MTTKDTKDTKDTKEKSYKVFYVHCLCSVNHERGGFTRSSA
jgi:hypothetical protein